MSTCFLKSALEHQVTRRFTTKDSKTLTFLEPPPPPKPDKTTHLGSPAPLQKRIAGTNPVMEGRFSKKRREDMLCTMQSGYIAPLGTFFSSTIMLGEDSKWGAAHSVHIRGLECKALGHFIRVLSTGKSCRGGAISGVPESAVDDGGMAG